jgi:hypothetical protein
MKRSRIYLMGFLLVAVLGSILALKAMSSGKGDAGGGDGDAIQIMMVSSRPGDAGEDGGAGGGDGARGNTTSGGQDPASSVSVTLVGRDGVADGGGASGDRATDGGGGGEAELPPLAALGAAEGIHTKMDSGWFPEREAAEWFQPLELDFQAARPLTPERYKEVLGEHHDRIGDVLKRSAEIGDHSSPEDGVLFLEAWNALVDQYKAEAYGS